MDDQSNPILDATVWVDGCTGTLIAPNLVIVAAHCIGGKPKFLRRGFWNTLTRTIRINFGNKLNEWTYQATSKEFNIPGAIDVALLRLREPVPPSIAIPSQVLTRAPGGQTVEEFLQGKTFVTAGWGDRVDVRETHPLRFDAMPYEQFGTLDPARFRAVGDDDLEPGDSGSPLYWVSPITNERWVVGVAQGVERNGGRFYATAFTGGAEPNKGTYRPSLSSWLSRELADTLPKQPILPLYSWWNNLAKDNLATTSARYDWYDGDHTPSAVSMQEGLSHIWKGRQMGDYGLYRLEGYLFDPSEQQPEGTIPLFRWFNVDRGDHFLSSDPRWTIPTSEVIWQSADSNNGILDKDLLDTEESRRGYRLVRFEGYAWDPKRPQPPGSVPLFSWWNRDRQDNFATTNPRYNGILVDDLTWNGEFTNPRFEKSGYSRYRLEGWIPAPLLT